MPLYVYECRDCEEIFEVRHSMLEKIEVCQACESEEIVRVPSMPIYFSNNLEENKEVGSVVKKHIREAKEELSLDKKGLKGKKI